MFQQRGKMPQLYDFEPLRANMRDEVLEGLQKSPKTLPSKYFYDEIGSHLFERICELEEYYVTRTELSIMQQRIAEIVEPLGSHCLLIEYGSGSSRKTRMLLDALPEPAGYVPIDISREMLQASAAGLTEAYPQLEVLPVCADYTSAFQLPAPARRVGRRLVYFPGSTIGNFEYAEAQHFLRQVAQTCQGGGLLIGVDLKKNSTILHRAYNDRHGVTARFNLHLLARINAELGANFCLDQFGHYAFYHPSAGRVEMHLVSLRKQFVRIGEVEIPFDLGESIWTESSYKYTLEEFARLAAGAAFTVKQVWTDPRELFSVQYLVANE